MTKSERNNRGRISEHSDFVFMVQLYLLHSLWDLQAEKSDRKLESGRVRTSLFYRSARKNLKS